jgi:hypothetical protein
VQYFPLQKNLRLSAVASLCLLLAAGCSSRNPDALTGMNVDENAAMMNADELNTTEAPANEQAAAPSSNETSGETASTKPPKEVTTTDDEEANSTETDQIIQPDEPTTGNQSTENDDEPHDQP